MSWTRIGDRLSAPRAPSLDASAQRASTIAADRRTLNQYVDLLNTIAKVQAKLATAAAYDPPAEAASS